MSVYRNDDGHVAVGFSAKSMMTKEQIESFSKIALCIDIADVESLVQEYRRLETVGPIFDPTAFMRTRYSLDGHLKLAAAFLKFRTVLESFRPTEDKS